MDSQSTRVLTYDHFEDIIEDFGTSQVSTERLRELGIGHILMKNSGYMKFSLILTKKKLFDLFEKDFSSIVEERIPGFKGVYGYYGASPELLRTYKELQEVGTDEAIFTAVVEYEGPSLSVNSGPLVGMVIIDGNYSNINFKSIIS